MTPQIRLGVDLEQNLRKIILPYEALSRHLHLVGATGSGKTVAIHTITRPIMMATGRQQCSMFIFDLMGNVSLDSLRWIASSKCPDHVRRRLIYIEPANSDYVVPFNPLRFVNDENRYYHVSRTVDLILRAWAAQDLSLQPRLMQWSYKAVSAIAALGLPLAMTRFLLHPGTQEHKRILEMIPGDIQYHWAEILSAKGGQEAVKILESTRNRFDPMYEAPQAKRMFSTLESGFDVERFIRDKRIVIVNLAKLGKLPKQLGSTIGSLMFNEVLETVFSMAVTQGREAVEPTYVLMDEFQQFAASPDIEDCLPTCRQMGLRLILAHQSFSQLDQREIDLTNMIWQARNRLMFANSAEDADIIADELAKMTFDRMRIKSELTSRRQRISGYRIEWLKSAGVSRTHADSVIEQRSIGYNRGESTSYDRNDYGQGTRTTNTGQSDGRTTGGTKSESESLSESQTEHLVPIHEEVEEVGNISYLSFEEHRLEWMQTIRQLKTGHAFGKFVDDPNLYRLLIDHRPVQMTKRMEQRLTELLQRNYEQDLFLSKEEIDRLAEIERVRLLTPPTIHLPAGVQFSSETSGPFRSRKRNSDKS